MPLHMMKINRSPGNDVRRSCMGIRQVTCSGSPSMGEAGTIRDRDGAPINEMKRHKLNWWLQKTTPAYAGVCPV